MRPNNFLLNTGRIFLQYIDDMYIKIENTRLDYLRKNQAQIRSELYQGVADSVSDGNRSAASIGRRVILPASFIGGPRDMRCRYLNPMTLVQNYGKPDLFITITCNPNWPEIQSHLTPTQTAQDRPDLVARIFHSKLVVLKKLIMDDNIFGPVAARVQVVEFQKRGLPHAHILLIFKGEHKILNPESFDRYVCAELPSTNNPFLRNLVVNHIMHGPCGTLNPKCACMKEKNHRRICKFKYPKAYADFTTCGEDSYPIYRRRESGDTIRIRGATLDNQWVIPYNPFLLATFNCHINVEVCSTIEAVKYLYKYVYKGHDRVSFHISRNGQGTEDEITSYQSGRWISPLEAAWRIYGFNLFEMSPAVIPLPVHLPHMQCVTFNAYENLQNIVDNEKRRTTMLMGFFTHYQKHPDDILYFYHEFPLHYVWNSSSKVWTPRKIPKAVGRLTYVNPAKGERYYLRLLLTHIKGPPSFDAILICNGVKCGTFQEAAKQMGLVDDDNYIDSCMEEAKHTHMPSALRRLFATLLVYCEHVDPHSLWAHHYESFSEDFARQKPNQTTKILHLTCVALENYLDTMGKSLQHFQLDTYNQSETLECKISWDISDALHAPIPTCYNDAPELLNQEQLAVFDCIMHHVTNDKPGAFFVDGPGGTGKTFLYCALYVMVRRLGKIVLPTATSGIAASNLPTGRTAHSRFKLPIDDTGSLVCNVSKQSSLGHLLSQSSLIIWD